MISEEDEMYLFIGLKFYSLLPCNHPRKCYFFSYIFYNFKTGMPFHYIYSIDTIISTKAFCTKGDLSLQYTTIQFSKKVPRCKLIEVHVKLLDKIIVNRRLVTACTKGLNSHSI